MFLFCRFYHLFNAQWEENVRMKCLLFYLARLKGSGLPQANTDRLLHFASHHLLLLHLLHLLFLLRLLFTISPAEKFCLLGRILRFAIC